MLQPVRALRRAGGPLPTHPVAALALAVALSLGASTAASAATTATWDGAGSSVTWSAAGNWSEGVAPSGSVGTLTLPATGLSCLGWSCTYAVDDVSGLAVGTLEIDSGADFLVTPMSSANSIELLGGLDFDTGITPTSDRLLTRMVVPLVLGAAQTWNLSGARGTPTQLTLGAVTGELEPLTIELSGGATLETPELDTGPLSISGPGTVSLASQMTAPADGIPVAPPPLIGTKGVALANGASLTFTSPGAVSGPISVAPGSYSTLEVGHGVAPDGTVVVAGPVTMRAASTLELWIDQPAVSGTRPRSGSDNSQLTTLGNLVLHNASLDLSQGNSDTQVSCANLAGGQTYTLVSAAKLVGTFSGITNGQVIPLGACNPLATGPSHAVIIRYNTATRPETVTATVVGAAQIRAEMASALLVNATQAYLTTVLGAGGYSTSFNAPAAGALTLTWTARVHGRLVTAATGSNVAGQVGRRRVPIKLTAAGRRLLRRSGRLTLTATAQFTPNGQQTVTVKRPVRLG